MYRPNVTDKKDKIVLQPVSAEVFFFLTVYIIRRKLQLVNYIIKWTAIIAFNNV